MVRTLCIRRYMIVKLVACLLIAGGLQVSARQAEREQDKSRDYSMSMLRPVGFNYLIYSNTVFSAEAEVLSKRNVYLLMDENAFNEANLKELFGVLSDAFPEPKTLSVTVHTSLEQVRPLGPSGISEEPDPPRARNHRLAGYLRMGDNEFFRYIAHPPAGKWTTVVLRGVDPTAGDQK